MSRVVALAALSIVAVACGGSPSEKDGSSAAAVSAPIDPIVACAVDADCTAVPRAACDDGSLDAVNVNQMDAYYAAHCGDATPDDCSATPVTDARVAICDRFQGCVMTAIEQIACKGFAPQPRHECPSGYDCALRPPGDVPGRCVAHVDPTTN